MKELCLFTTRYSRTRLSALLCLATLWAASSYHTYAQDPVSPEPAAQPTAGAIMSEYKGVKLGMKREDVRAIMGKTELEEKAKDRFIIKGDDRLTAHYDNDHVRAIQLYFVDVKNAPDWEEVVGDADVVQMESGAKRARREVAEGKFWVSMYQSKDGAVTTITISR